MKIEDIIIERDHHRHRHHHLHHLHLTSHPAAAAAAATAAFAAATTATTQGITSLSPSASTTVKRSSSVAINAPFPKNHKNETTCTKMSDENNSISATAIAIKNGLNGATINTSSISSLTGTSTLPLSSTLSSSTSTASSSLLGSGGAAIVAAVTDRIHVSRANHHHHSTSTSTSINNGAGTASTTTTATTTISSRHHVSGITRIKSEPVENNDGGADYSMCKSSMTNAGAAGSEIVGRIPTSSSSAATAVAENTRSSQGIGGRLQFFKDGKFILELARAKEGEKSGWVSVPRKQFRSPSAASSTVTPTYPKNESSTSLSFSDDNSSIQSSPWQRDHCWKQSTPRRGISKEMCFHFKRTKHILVLPNGLKTARIKRRKPLDNSVCQTPFRLLNNGCSIAAQEIKNERYSPDNSSTTAMDDEKSSDESSTEKDSSGRESSKTPTPETQLDTVDGPLKAEIIKTKDNQLTTKSMNGEKRLKPRAKLTTIIQKLIDRLPTGLFHLSKTQIIGGATQQQHAHSHSHHQAHSSHHIPATTSRLASELHYHQQHVSPRKRILREFEKVSLEDTPAINSKRSRAKGNSPAAAVGTLPLTPIPTSRSVVVPSSSNNYVTNGNRTEVISSSNTTPSSTPTRLYSSYSIHSLLGGNNNSSGSGSGSSNNNANNNRIKAEHSINQSGGVYSDPSYLRAMLASPKSPEGCTNTKSLSAGGSAKKRSPPYSPLSEIHHQHQHHSRNRSPNVDGSYGNMRSPPEAHSNRSYGNNVAASSSRLTPPHGYLSSPKNSSNSSTVDGYKIKSENLTNSSPNHHFYSPYMLSPKYVPPPNSVSPNSLLTSDNYHPKLKGPRSPSQQGYRAGVYRTQSPHAASNHSGIPRESSPPNALQSSPSPGINNSGVGSGGITSSSLSSTPRTVPKKTVSIRRQFASPSSSSSSPGLSEHLKNAGSNNVGKVEERTAMSPDNRRTPTQQDAAAVSAAAAAAAAAANKYHQHAAAAMMQRSSPLSGGASSLYYMYPPPNGSPSPHHSSSSPSPSPSSSYIPPMNPYYHPYVSTLAALRNPLWMHHYPAAAAAAAAAASAAAAMLPSPAAGPVPQQAMPFFPYNGVSVTTSSHLHHSSFAPMHLTAAGQLGLQPPLPPASLNRSPPTTDDTISPSSIKEEHSSDVPLNLSKH